MGSFRGAQVILFLWVGLPKWVRFVILLATPAFGGKEEWVTWNVRVPPR